MSSMTDCGVCGEPLVYAPEAAKRTCDCCGATQTTMIWCAAGHFVCDACHGATAAEGVRRLLAAATSPDPGAILEQVMAFPGLPMHGPEHHAIVPGVIVAAARNAGAAVPEGDLESALARGAKIPGGWCGYYGACGAAVGVGIAVSTLSKATPLTGKERSLALGATSLALARMVDDQPRCCKRASRLAVEAAVEYLREHLDIDLPAGERARCASPDRNAQCAGPACPFHPQDARG
jgi:hypothetical protein